MPEMLDRFEPGDWRFLGSPIDFIVFDGLTAGLVTQNVLVEVKTNDSLSRKQAVIKASIDAGAVPPYLRGAPHHGPGAATRAGCSTGLSSRPRAGVTFEPLPLIGGPPRPGQPALAEVAGHNVRDVSARGERWNEKCR